MAASVKPSATSTCSPIKACISASRSRASSTGKLRELRFHLERQQIRITYYVASGRRIVLLTVFAKTRQRERLEIARAVREMARCIAEGHTTEETT